MSELDFKLKLSPELDVSKLNGMLSRLKSSLGSLGNGIELIDTDALKKGMGSIEGETKKLADQAMKAAEASDKLASGINKAGKESTDLNNKFKSMTDNIVQFAAGSLLAGGVTSVVDTFKKAADAGIEFQKSLADLSAITGVQGAALDNFGQKAMDLSNKFGGSAKDQIESFKGVLSRLGPDIAKSPEAMERMATAINTMSKASGLDAASSMDALTTSMLQFNVSLDDPIKAAGEMEKMMNVLAAGAQYGAAEIPQVSEAIVVAGVAANGAKMSFEETNAAIQTLAAGGKYGAEAGTALRNVLGMMQSASKPAEAAFKSMGTSSKELGQILTTNGLGPAIEKLRDGFNKLGSDAAKNKALMEAFGTENAAAAGVLIQRAEMIGDLTKQVTGTQTAYKQAAVNQATISAQLDAFKAKVSNFGITLFNTLQPVVAKILGAFTGIAGGLEFAGNAIKKLIDYLKPVSPVLGVIAAGAAILAAGLYLASPAFLSAASGAWAFTAALLANPITWVVAGLAAGVAALAYFEGASKRAADNMVEQANAAIKVNEENKKLANNQIQQEQSNLKLVASYEALIKQREKLIASGKDTKSIDEQLNQAQEKLNGQYPNLINLTKSHGENLKSLKEGLGVANADTSKFTAENQKLVQEFEKLATKSGKTADEQKRLHDLTEQLRKKFPEVQISTENLSASFNGLETAAGLSSNKINQLKKDVEGYDEAIRAENLKKARGEVSKAKEQAISDATSFFSTMDDKIKSFVSGGNYKSWSGYISDLLTNFDKQLDAAAKKNDKGAMSNIRNSFLERIKKDFPTDEQSRQTLNSAVNSMFRRSVDYAELLAPIKVKVEPEINKNNNGNNGNEGNGVTNDDADKSKKNTESILKDYDQLKQTIAAVTKQKETSAEKERALQGRDKNILDDISSNEIKLNGLKQQSAALDELIKKYEVVTDDNGKIIKVSPKVTDADKDKLQSEIYSMKQAIEESETSKINLEVKLKNLSQETLKKFETLTLNQLKIDADLGLAIPADPFAALQSEIDKLKDKAQELGWSMALSMNPANKILLSSQLADLRLLIQSKEEQLRKDKKQGYNEELSDLQKKDQKELKEIEDKFKKEADIIKQMTSILEGNSIAKVDKNNDDQIKQLDELKQAEVITEEQYNQRKEEIEQQHQARLQAIRDASKGLALEAERQQSLQVLKEQETRIQKEMELAKQNNDTKKYKELNDQLTEVQKGITEKGDYLTAYSAELQNSMTEIFGSLLGDEESMKKPWRSLFSVIVGGLKALITSVVLEAVLTDKVTTALGVFAPLAKAALVGIISAGLNAIAEPVLNSIASFSTGGRVDEPTLAVVGDASRSRAGKNTEWIFRDDQLLKLIEQALSMRDNKMASMLNDVTPQKHLEQVALDNIIKELRGIRETIVRVQPFFGEMTAEKLINYIEDFSRVQELDKQLYSNKINQDQYFKSLKSQVIRVPSYASGSDFIDSPQLALIGDAGSNNPEIVLNSPQLRAIIKEAGNNGNNSEMVELLKDVRKSLKILEGKDPNIYMDSEKVTKEVNRQNNKNKYL